MNDPKMAFAIPRPFHRPHGHVAKNPGSAANPLAHHVEKDERERHEREQTQPHRARRDMRQDTPPPVAGHAASTAGSGRALRGRTGRSWTRSTVVTRR